MLEIGWYKKIEILVPKDYNQNTYAQNFRERYLGKSFDVYQNWGFCGASGTAHWTNTVYKISDKSFDGETDNLIPGKKYTVKFYETNVDNLPIETVVTLLKEHKALFVGMPGLMLAYEITKGEILKEVQGRFIDYRRKTLSLNKSGEKVPTVDTYIGNHQHHFYLGSEIKKSDLIICFTENG